MTLNRSELNAPSPSKKVEFGQEELAEFILEEVNRDPEIHIAINGPWGSGKTTVLRKVRDEIEKQEDSSISVWYEPWRYSPDQTTLRRTFLKTAYKSASDDVDGVNPLDDSIFHTHRHETKTRDWGDLIKELYKTIKIQSRLAILVLFSIAVLMILQLLSSILLSGTLASLLGAIFQIIAFALIVLLATYLNNELATEIADATTFEVVEPKINEIDLFEQKYNNLLSKLDEEDKELVVFIDDIDRCDNSEIREVITGISTYLDPDDEGAPVSIIAAIDAPRVVESFDSEEDGKALRKPNIINKTFQIVLPVSTLSQNDVSELIKITSDELDYSLSEEDIKHMSRVAVQYGQSNLRIIRSAMSDLVWMHKLGSKYLSNREYSNSQSFKKILDSNPALFRIALIKLLSENEALRKFVTDASIWLNKNERGNNVEWDLFEIHPKFEPGGMDPRPLLALNAPNEYSANIYDYDEIQRKVERGNTNEAINSASKYGPAARIDIAYRLLDYDLSNQDMNEKANFVNTIVDISINSIDAIDENQSYLFEDCFNIIKENRNIVNNVSRNNYEKWIRFAHKIGNDSLDMLLDPSSPFMREDKTNFLRKISEIALEFDSDFIDRVLEIEVNEVENGNEVNSAQRMKKIFQEENIKDAENAPEYLLQLLDNWSFSDNPDGPPESLLNEDVIELFGQKEYREKAMQVFDKVGSQGDPGRDYVDILMENNWPRRRERDS